MFGVQLTPAGAETHHEPPESPDAVLVTTTQALLAALGDDDLAGLVAAGAVVTGSPEAVRRLLAAVHVPAAEHGRQDATVQEAPLITRRKSA